MKNPSISTTLSCIPSVAPQAPLTLSRRHALASFLGVLAAAQFPLSSQAATTLQISGSYDEITHQTQNLRYFAQQAASASNNELTFNVSINAQHTPMAEVFPALSQGKLAIGEMRMAGLSKQFPVLTLDSIPFLVHGYEEAALLWEVSKEKITHDLLQQGVRLLYVTPWPEQSLFSRVPLQTTQDLKNLRFWARNELTHRLEEKLGAKAVDFPTTELPQAIENNRIDAMFASNVTGVEGQAWKIMKYCYEVRAWIPKNMVCMSESVFKKLSPAAQKGLLEAAQAAEKNGWQLVKTADEAAKKVLQEHKVSMLPTPSDLRQSLDMAGERLGTEWAKTAGLTNTSVLLAFYQKRNKR